MNTNKSLSFYNTELPWCIVGYMHVYELELQKRGDYSFVVDVMNSGKLMCYISSYTLV